MSESQLHDSQLQEADFGTLDRRKNDAVLLFLVQQIHDGQAALNKQFVKHTTEDLPATLADLIKSSFPDGDPDGHRRHHEAVIRKAEERAEFWATMRKELGKYGLIGFIGWAGYALWQAFLLGPKK